jgi:hypothetical protein
LTQRDSDHARAVAQTILQRDPWDLHLSAYALKVLYARDADAGFEAMQRIARVTTDKSIIGAMIENVLSDSARYINSVGRDLAAKLAAQLTEDVASQLDPDEVSEFLSLHSIAWRP